MKLVIFLVRKYSSNIDVLSFVRMYACRLLVTIA